MELDRLQGKLPEAIIDWYVQAGVQSTIKSIGSRREGLTLVVKMANAIHTWRYVECEPSTDGRTKPMADWELEVLVKKSALTKATACSPRATDAENVSPFHSIPIMAEVRLPPEGRHRGRPGTVLGRLRFSNDNDSIS